MSLTLKDLHVAVPPDEGIPDDQLWETTYRPATLADLVEVLMVEGAGEVKVTDSGKRDWIDPVIRLVPNTLEYGDRYLILPLDDA